MLVGGPDEDEIASVQCLGADREPVLAPAGQYEEQLVEVLVSVQGRGRLPRAQPAERGVVWPAEGKFAQLQHRDVCLEPRHVNRVQVLAKQALVRKMSLTYFCGTTAS